MKIPKHIKVGGKVYGVLYPHTFTEVGNLSGQSCHLTNTIRLSIQGAGGERRARENVEEVFVHEVLHCVDVVYNAGKLDEDTVDRLAQGLYQVLSDSGLLARGEE